MIQVVSPPSSLPPSPSPPPPLCGPLLSLGSCYVRAVGVRGLVLVGGLWSVSMSG
jgi:hypothetical protein